MTIYILYSTSSMGIALRTDGDMIELDDAKLLNGAERS